MLEPFARPFHAGSKEYLLPLQRYLPPLPHGALTEWLKMLSIPKGSWLLDPFGAQPALAIEAAQAGMRILVAVNNPILAHLLETIASAPQREAFQSILTELGSTRRADERLERAIRSSYESPCPVCNATATVTAYLWNAGQDHPFARLLKCSSCGLEAEKPICPEDLKNQILPGSTALTRARALARVSNPGEGEIHQTIEKTLETYPERALYLLSTLINKSEGIQLSPDRRRLLEALLLHTCDAANTLWPWPNARTRPRQLTVPPQYRENNLWLALEEAVEVWAQARPPRPIHCTRWPEKPPESGGICIYPGRIRTLFPLPNVPPIQAILTVLPRPNQAFWTLSALWSGWLWGREAVQSLKIALERRRYDWAWHTAALYQVWSTLQKHLPPTVPILAHIPEIAPGFIGAILSSAHAAGLQLQGMALRRDQETLQTEWHISSSQPSPLQHPPTFSAILHPALQECLQERQEPAAYLQLYTAGFTALVQQNALFTASEPPTDQLNRFQTALHQTLQDTAFRRSDPTGGSVETGWWELTVPPNPELSPLADQVEMQIIRFLLKQPEESLTRLHQMLAQAFPGLLTPPANLIQAILESYAEPLPNTPETWRLQSQELPSLRRNHIQTAHKLLCHLGSRFGYTQSGNSPLLWLDQNGKPHYAFHIVASSIISRFVYAPPPAPHNIIVLPGGRSNLLRFKLDRDPRLNRAAQNWQFLKFRHLRQLAERPDVTLEEWDRLLNADPPRWEKATQMTIF